MYGHKTVFVIGWVWFALWSIVASFSPPSGLVLFCVARALQGIGPALLVPSAIALIGQNLPSGSGGTWPLPASAPPARSAPLSAPCSPLPCPSTPRGCGTSACSAFCASSWPTSPSLPSPASSSSSSSRRRAAAARGRRG